MGQGRAFNEGWAASKAGKGFNPYPAGTHDYNEWNRGFNSHNSYKL